MEVGSYAPAVKRIDKYEGKQLKWIPPVFLETWSLAYELASYSLAPPGEAAAKASPAEATGEQESAEPAPPDNGPALQR
mgnify:FL=1